jgi:hypothetical protein
MQLFQGGKMGKKILPLLPTALFVWLALRD